MPLVKSVVRTGLAKGVARAMKRARVSTGVSSLLATKITFSPTPGSWEAHYWTSTEQLLASGDYVEFSISTLNFGRAFGVIASGNNPATFAGSFVVWPFANATTVYAMDGGGIVAAYAPGVSLFDTYRFTRTGTDLVVSLNGVVLHTFTGAATGPLRVFCPSHSGEGKVCINSINGKKATTFASLAATVVEGEPFVDYRANHAAFYFSPYNWLPGTSANNKESGSPGAYVKFRFTGSRAALLYDVTHGTPSGYRTIAVQIDGGVWTRYELNADRGICDLQIANGLSSGTHTATIMLSDIYLGGRVGTSPLASSVFFHGVRLPVGAALLAPTIKPKRIMHWGDSNSVGAEALGIAAYAEAAVSRKFAELMNAEYGLSAFPGQGWLTTPGAPIPTFQSGWNVRDNGTSRLTAGVFTDEPDYFVIIHGQNDNVSTNPVLPIATVCNAMLAATTSTKILVGCPCGRHRRTEIMNAVTAMANPRVVFLDNPQDLLAIYGANGANTHLTDPGQTQHAQNLFASWSAL